MGSASTWPLSPSRVEETKTGEPLELPVTRQLAAILERPPDGK